MRLRVVDIRQEVTKRRITDCVAKCMDMQGLPVQVVLQFFLIHRKAQLSVMVWVWNDAVRQPFHVMYYSKYCQIQPFTNGMSDNLETLLF